MTTKTAPRSRARGAARSRRPESAPAHSAARFTPPNVEPRSRLESVLFAPVDVAPLVWFRIAFGLIMLLEVWRYFSHGWIDRYYQAPPFLFTYFGLDWIRPWPGAGMEIHFLCLGALAAAIALGFHYRIAAALFTLGFTYVFLLDQTRYLNHFYLVCLYSLILVFVPAHRALSLDASFDPTIRSATAPAWSLWLLRAQMCIVYFMGGVAKFNGDWLHGEPVRMWLSRRPDFPVLGGFFGQEWMVQAIGHGGLLFDLSVPWLLIWKRTRWLAFGMTVFFCLMNARLFQIGIFPWLALGATILLFAPRLPHPIPKLWKSARASTPARDRAALAPSAVVALLGLWLAFQILVPLRHWLYPGNPEWTEEGHQFAWRMKLREKHGDLRIIARDPATDATWRVDPLDYVTRYQLRKAADNPEMIRQLCHHVAEEWRRKHHSNIEVRVDARASLNGRPMQRLIDPSVDLASEPGRILHADWILPLTTPLEPARGALRRGPGVEPDPESE
jgi:vitamin K-dependent gamma-carboxylase